MLLKNKIAVITGIGPGMGHAIAVSMAREGAKLAIGARTESYLSTVAREIEENGGEVIAVPTDLASRESCEGIVNTALETFGGVDILVQNGADTGDPALIADADIDRWRQTMDCNLYSAIHLFRACLPSMKERGDGRVILVNSGAGNNHPPEYLASYGASKAALASLVRSIAVEYGKDGIRCNGIHLGPVDGQNFRPWLENVAREQGRPFEEVLQAYVEAEFPLRYIPTPEECAGTVLYLASDLARVVTGQAISVNGGQWFGK